MFRTKSDDVSGKVEAALIEVYGLKTKGGLVDNEIGGGGGTADDPPYVVYVAWKYI